MASDFNALELELGWITLIYELWISFLIWISQLNHLLIAVILVFFWMNCSLSEYLVSLFVDSPNYELIYNAWNKLTFICYLIGHVRHLLACNSLFWLGILGFWSRNRDEFYFHFWNTTLISLHDVSTCS